MIIDSAPYDLVSYSDIDLALPGPFSCADPIIMDVKVPALSRLTLHANPGTDELWITGLASGSNPIEIRDPLGRIVHARLMTGETVRIETGSWSTGTYLIRVVDPAGNLQTLRWMKE